MRESSTSARKKWVYFHNNVQLAARIRKEKKKNSNDKKMMHSNSALLLNLQPERVQRRFFARNGFFCSCSFNTLGARAGIFFSCSLLLSVHIIIIVSQLHLFTPIYASWFILFMQVFIFVPFLLLLLLLFLLWEISHILYRLIIPWFVHTHCAYIRWAWATNSIVPLPCWMWLLHWM